MIYDKDRISNDALGVEFKADVLTLAYDPCTLHKAKEVLPVVEMLARSMSDLEYLKTLRAVIEATENKLS